MFEILYNKKFKIVKLGGALEIVTITPLHSVDEKTSPERLIDILEARCRARSQNSSLGFFYGLTSGQECIPLATITNIPQVLQAPRWVCEHAPETEAAGQTSS